MNKIKSIKKNIFNILSKTIPSILYRKISYSQTGEDMILSPFFPDKYKGFYIDVGANHPYRFSNTAIFYKKGWRGINIEPTPNLYKKLCRIRKRDINLNIGISQQQGELILNVFNETPLNTFDKESAMLIEQRSPNKYKIVERIPVPTYPLKDIISKYIPANQQIDLLTIDAEGLDFDVLQSNDWNLYLPSFILVEGVEHITPEAMIKDKIYIFLTEKKYTIVGKTMYSSLFKLND